MSICSHCYKQVNLGLYTNLHIVEKLLLSFEDVFSSDIRQILFITFNYFHL